MYSTKFLAHCYERSLIKGKALEFNFSQLSAFISLLFDRDSGHKTFLEDAFENEARMIPGGKWGPASSPWTNVVCFLLLLWFTFNFCRILSGLFLVAAIRDQYFRVSFNKQINYNLKRPYLFRDRAFFWRSCANVLHDLYFVQIDYHFFLNFNFDITFFFF